MRKPSTLWLLGLSAYWFSTSWKWFIILLGGMLQGRVQELVPGGTASTTWGMVVGFGALEACVGPALFGFLSDRTRSRFGRRIPFLVAGTLLTLVSFWVLASAHSIALIVLGYFILQVSDDIGTAPYAAMIPELVPQEVRGVASGLMGFLQQFAQIVAALVSLALTKNPNSIWISIGVVNVLGAIIVIATVGAKSNLDVESPKAARFSLDEWLRPWKLPDFNWIWLTRFLNSVALTPIMGFALYYFQRDLGMTKEQATKTQLYIAILLSLVAALSSIVAGKLADRWGRKGTVMVSGYIMLVGLLLYASVPQVTFVYISVVIFGLGYGAYLAADWALASDIMPDESDFAKDMGMWSMSIPLGQAVAGVFGVFVDTLNRHHWPGYAILWTICAVIFVASTSLVRFVKGST